MLFASLKKVSASDVFFVAGTLLIGSVALAPGVEVHGCDLFTFRDGKIVLKNSYRKNRPPLQSSRS